MYTAALLFACGIPLVVTAHSRPSDVVTILQAHGFYCLSRLNASVFLWARQEALEGIKRGCKKVIDFFKRMNVWYILQ